MKIKNFPNITFTAQVFLEGETYVSYAPEFSVASCGKTIAEAKEHLKEAMEGFLETAEEMGTLQEILEDAGYVYKRKHWFEPQLLVMDRLSLA